VAQWTFSIGSRSGTGYKTAMKKHLLLSMLAVGLIVGTASPVNAQSAFFTYTGVPTNLTPGGSFTIGVNITFTAGGNINNLAGFSYWMWQPSGANFPFAITNRNVTGSIFTDLQSSGLQYPQPMTPINRNPDGSTNGTDLGALFAGSSTPQPNGTYFVANLTFSISNDFMPGSYSISNTTQATPGVGGRFSVITDSDGDTFAIAASPFNITVLGIPEPSTYALLGMGIIPAAVAAYRRRRAA
jgi:hypothetical protein